MSLLAGDPVQMDSLPGKQCGVCQATTTPIWRKGTNGEVLCNSCGVKSELRKKLLPHDNDERMDIDKQAKKSSNGSKNLGISANSGPVGNGGACYYCKWCQKTWAISAFPSRQSFGAHCSNCSRKRRNKGANSFLLLSSNKISPVLRSFKKILNTSGWHHPVLSSLSLTLTLTTTSLPLQSLVITTKYQFAENPRVIYFF